MDSPGTPSFTSQQHAAITARGHSVVLSSGAGCGKTFVLTQRYLSHLKHDLANVAEIVAITFTDRAAREMRDRIRRTLTQERQREPSPVWDKHLRDLETATIATIHSFCGNLLRQFAVPAGLDPQFDVLNPVLAEHLLADVLRTTLEHLLTSDEPAGSDLRELVALYGWKTITETLRELLDERDPAGWMQWLSHPAIEIATAWATQDLPELLPRWVAYLTVAAPPIAHLVNLFETVPCSGPLMRANVQKVLEGLPKLAHATNLADAVKELTEAAKVSKERAKAWPDDASYTLVKDAMEDFRKALPERMELFTTEHTDPPTDIVAAAVVGQRFARVAYAVNEAFTRRKAQLGVLDFQDLLLQARDLVRDQPEVRTALQARYRFLLLDEMQDTDPVQMEFIELLCGIGFDGGKLFAVGDQKQSIYRFRGADVALFQTLQQRVPVAGRLNLTQNFRSQPGILTFVNALCSRRMTAYEPLVPSRTAAHDRPCVEFLWSVPEDDIPETASDVRHREATMLALHIRHLLSDPFPWVTDPRTQERRPAQLGDIVLLFRSMSNVAIYEEALRQQGLNYYLVGGRAFFAQQEIYDLLNLLRTLENPADAISLAGVLRSPFGCLSDETLLLLGLHREGLWAGLHDAERRVLLTASQRTQAERMRTLLEEWRADKDRLTIAQLLTRAIADTGYDAAMQFEFLGERKLANLWKMIELARSFDRSGLFGLPEFIARLDELITSQPREEQAATQPENADVIKIMSIHQAKGLEFPIVFVPDFAAETRRGTAASAQWDRVLGCLPRPPAEDPPLFTDFAHLLGTTSETMAEWHEDLRILYVACTRPRDLLILSAGFKEPFPLHSPEDLPVPLKATNAWIGVLHERFNIRTGRCIAKDVAEPLQARVQITPAVVAAPETPRDDTRPPMPLLDPAHYAPLPTNPLSAVIDAALLFGHTETPLRQRLLNFDPANVFTYDESLSVLQESPWPTRWEQAIQGCHALPYAVPLDASPGAPVVRGVLEHLWQEADGWHLFLTNANDGRTLSELRLQTRAVETHLGEPLQTATLFELATGEAVTLVGKAERR